jgi:cellulose synthase/poly-beta-1,6-N-acetylglucosamine synthase-like glycosyltransferase
MNPLNFNSFTSWLLTALSFLALLPSTILLIEIIAAWVPRRPIKNQPHPDLRVAILVPAHDEASQIETTVHSLKRELGQNDRLIVVADNCQDLTAQKAREAGASVIERTDRQHRGKGFAISFGVDHLRADPPDAVVLVDADCQITQGQLNQLAQTACAVGRPVQADYLLTTPPSANHLSAINALAILVRNRVRPLGLQRLADVCQLTGSGMAFPWPVLRNAPPMQENLVEDLALGLELSLMNHPPLLLPEVRIVSNLPTTSKAGINQRRRWEHGQMHTMKRYIPRLIGAFLKTPQKSLLGLTLDLMVPPLSFLVLIHLAIFGVIAVNILFGLGTTLPLVLVTLSFALLCLAIALAWFKFGRLTLPLGGAVRIPFYVLWKMGLYVSLLVKGKQKSWERTERLSPPKEPPKA